MRLGLVLVMLALGLAARCQPPHGAGGVAAAGPPVPASTLVGAWNGRWTAASGDAQGVVELIVTHGPDRDGVLGQFTFLTGSASRTLRYAGRVENGTLVFPLVGEGRIVLGPRDAGRPGEAASLRGEWVDTRGALPAPRGTLQLGRAAIR